MLNFRSFHAGKCGEKWNVGPRGNFPKGGNFDVFPEDLDFWGWFFVCFCGKIFGHVYPKTLEKNDSMLTRRILFCFQKGMFFFSPSSKYARFLQQNVVLLEGRPPTSQVYMEVQPI